MRTHSSSNLFVESPPNPSTFNPKRHKRRRLKQPFVLKESPVDTMVDQRTMAELLHLLRACPHHGFTELHQLDTFYNALNPTDQDSLNSVAGGNLLERRTQDVLTIIKNKSKIAKLTHVVNHQTSVVTTVITSILKQFQATPPSASVKAVEGNSDYRPSGMANQIRPPVFTQLNVQNNQNRFSQPQGYNRGNNFNQDQSYQALTQQNQVVPLSESEKIKRMNDANMKAMQNQINNVKNELRNEMKNSIQASINTIANPTGELKAITTRSGIVLVGPSVPIPPPFINPKEDKRVEKTLTDQDLAEYTIKVLPPLVQKSKPPSQRNFFVHQRDPLHPNIPYPSRMLKQKQQEKDEVQINKFWQMFKQLHINITLANALILILKYQKMLKALLSNKEKLLELANTPLNENCSALGLPELISTRINLELANRAICTLAGIARDVFVLVGKFTFIVDFVIVYYESDPRVPLILGRPFLQTACALIDVHREEMILHDGDERLTLNIRHDTSSYSNQPQKESINMINIYDDSSEDFLEELFTTNHQSGNPTFSSHLKLTSPKVKDDIFDPEGGNVLIEKLLDLDSTKDPHEKLLNINLLLAKIKFLNNNHTPNHALKPLSPFLIPVEDNDSFLEKSDTSLSYLDNSLPEFETFIYHTEETNSGSTTTHADYSLPKYDSFLFEIEPDQGKLTSVVMKDNLTEPQVHVPNVLTTHPTLMLDSNFIPSDNSLPEYEIFYFDIKEKNSGTTTIHADISLPDLECFNFNDKPDLGELTSIVDSGIRENLFSATNVNLPPEEDHSPLFAYVVWIFLSFLTYLVVPLNLHSFGNEDTIFDPGIANYHVSSLLPDVSHRCETFMKFNVYPKLLNESMMEILSSNCSPMEQ
uniref:Reverse transcriptase domain-containing protein n=1 Tax=Tanacetum cinerariifolium TaxID=118510 RepID=A0A699J3P7_TANCI|nr:hypothetical protein [Tanacetum cinerariifolium]